MREREREREKMRERERASESERPETLLVFKCTAKESGEGIRAKGSKAPLRMPDERERVSEGGREGGREVYRTRKSFRHRI